jgi:hypothetical protein
VSLCWKIKNFPKKLPKEGTEEDQVAQTLSSSCSSTTGLKSSDGAVGKSFMEKIVFAKRRGKHRVHNKALI